MRNKAEADGDGARRGAFGAWPWGEKGEASEEGAAEGATDEDQSKEGEDAVRRETGTERVADESCFADGDNSNGAGDRARLPCNAPLVPLAPKAPKAPADGGEAAKSGDGVAAVWSGLEALR